MSLPLRGVSEIVLLCENRSELETSTEFYYDILDLPLVTAWKNRDGENYGRPIPRLEDYDMEDIKGEHEVWFKAGETLIGLWLPKQIPQEAQEPVSQWGDIWDQGGRHVHYALEVRHGELSTVKKRLRQEHVEFKIVEHPDYNNAISLFLKDPAGHVLEIAEPRLRIEAEKQMPDGKR